MADNPPVRFPLVEPLESRDQTTNYDAKIKNGIIEQSTRGTLRVVKRSGQTPKYQGMVGNGQGVTNYLNALYSISGDYFNSFSGTPILTTTEVTASAGFSPRYGEVAIGFLGNLYVMGGFNSSGVPLNDVWTSSNGGLTWTEVTSSAPWSPRGQAGGIVFQGSLYIMGGGASTTTSDFTDVWSTPDGINWTKDTSDAWPARRNFGLTASSSLMYVAGGAGSLYPNSLYPDTFYSDVYSSPDGVNWTKLVANAPWVARANFGFFYLNNALYVVAGQLTDPFNLATGDLWSSPTGATWTRLSSNPFNVAASGAWPVAAFDSYGMDFPLPAPVTVTGGSGGAAAFSFIDDDDDADDDFQGGQYVQLTFNAVGSGMTAAPTLTPGTSVGFNVGAYAFLDGTSNAGAKQLQATEFSGVIYLFEFIASGSFVSRIWQTTDGVTYTNLGSPGWPPRAGEFFAQGGLFMIGGVDGTPTYYNDVWEVTVGGTQVALNPNVANGFYHFSQTAQFITSPLLVFKSLNDLYDYNATTNSLTKLSNAANYPNSTVPGIEYLDGYFFVMTSKGQIYNSAINDPTTWPALGVVAMENEPAGGVAISKMGLYIVAFGQWSAEFFIDGGNTTGGISPLIPNTTLTTQIGCAQGESVMKLQASVIWIGQTQREGQGVYQMNLSFQPQRVSTPFVDRIIQNDPLTNISAFTIDTFGHSCYVLTLHTTNITLVYTFDSQLWTVWTSMTENGGTTILSLTSDAYGTVTATTNIPNGYLDGSPVVVNGAAVTGYNGIYNINVISPTVFTYQVGSALAANPGTAVVQNFTENCFSIVASAQIFDVDYVQGATNGIIFSQDIEDVTDNGGPVNLVIVTDRYDGGISTWKTCRRITLLGDIVPSNVVLSYSDNDYQSWSSARYMSVNEGQRATVTPAGRFRRRAFMIVHNLPTPFRAEALELELIMGGF